MDITKQKQMELALRQSEAQFRQLADATPQIAWAARPDGHQATDDLGSRYPVIASIPASSFSRAAGSTGLTMWALKPASCDRRLSSS